MRTVRIPQMKASRFTQLFPRPEFLGPLFWFSELSSHASLLLRGYLTLGWYIDDDRDAWSKRFLGFKNADANCVRGACAVLSMALSTINWNAEGRIAVCSAMSSAQTEYDPHKPQAILANHLAEQFGFQYLGATFKKAAHRRLHLLKGGAQEREEEVKGKYELTQQFRASLVIVVDDIVTRGDTTGDIARAIRLRYPNVEVVGIALGKSERASFADTRGVKLNNDHIPAKWAEIWDNS